MTTITPIEHETMIRWMQRATSTLEMLSIMQPLLPHEKDELMGDVCAHAGTPVEVLTMISGIASQYIRHGIALSPNVTMDILTTLADDGNAIPVRGVAESTKFSSEQMRPIFDKLKVDHDRGVRRNLAGNKNLPRDIMEELLLDDAEEVRSALAKNPSAPQDLLTRLASDPERKVRSAVVRNSANASLETLRALASDDDYHVRLTMTWQSDLPTCVQRTLFLDSRPFVRSSALERSYFGCEE